ncbi:MAG: glycosyltransferase family 2 protein [Planctomycetota bacterium]
MSTAFGVDIVTPAYNAADTIAQTIESVLAQTHRNWRLWIVDDGSRDQTAAVVRRYLDDARIRLLEQANQGAAHARNHGLDHCAAEFVTFLDSDDYWEPEFLERTLREFEHDPAVGLVWCEMQIRGDHSGTYRGGRPAVVGDAPDTLAAIYRSVTFLPSCTVFRSAPFRAGLRWRQDCSPMEDMPIFLAVAASSRIARVPEVLANYRIHGGSSTTARGALGRNYRSMVFAFRVLYRQYRHAIPAQEYRARMWWIYHHAADNLLSAGRPNPGLFLRALRYRPTAELTWKVLTLWLLRQLFRRSSVATSRAGS